MPQSILRQCVISVLAMLLLVPVAGAETIAVIGTGNVGGVLGAKLGGRGHTIVYGSRNPDRADVVELVSRSGRMASARPSAEAVVDADIVILAVPGLLVEGIVEELGDLSGKIVIDPTNPLTRDDSGRFIMGVESSNGELVQAAAPDAKVVKAFNTLSYQTMQDPSMAGGLVSVPLAGNDAAAKERVAELTRSLGLRPIDVGPIEHSEQVEGMLILWINARAAGNAFDFYLRKKP
ncbi:MAG: NADPH-dependent F420 reductase [Pseudomonadota bacterium]